MNAIGKRAIILGCWLWCGITGRDFLNGKTGVVLPEGISVCSTGVQDSDYCEPKGGGGSKWSKSENFPSFTVPIVPATLDGGVSLGSTAVPPTNAEITATLDLVRTNYLGSPYYGGNLHTLCKSTVQPNAIPTTQGITQDIDLAALIKTRSVSEVTLQLRAKLNALKIPASASIENDFRSSMDAAVAQKIQARFVWFVMQYPGGRPDISKNPHLQSCVAEATAHKKDKGGSSVVTGVAGFLILRNTTDATISDSSATSNALRVALQGSSIPAAAAIQLDGDISTSWTKSVEKVAQIQFSRKDLTVVSFPLWVQFE